MRLTAMRPCGHTLDADGLTMQLLNYNDHDLR